MRTLVVGAAGFIGRNALLHFPSTWEMTALHRSRDGAFEAFLRRNGLSHVKPYVCDASDVNAVEAVSENIGRTWDQCLFLAANTQTPHSVEHPHDDLMSNTTTLLNVLTVMDIDHLVFLSSGAVYLGKSGLVGPETPLSPDLPYAISKLASELYIHGLHGRRGNPKRATVVRFFGAYGPYEPDRKIYTRVTRQFAFAKDSRYTVYGDGNNYIDAMYVEDTIEALRATLEQPPATGIETVDLGVGAVETVNEMVERAARAFGLEARISHSDAPTEYLTCHIDPQRFTRRYGFTPTVSFEVGLVRLAEHLQREDDYART
jgi:nucleoside-diphosphate-sugar epimerase